jgi:hypothetical protein
MRLANAIEAISPADMLKLAGIFGKTSERVIQCKIEYKVGVARYLTLDFAQTPVKFDYEVEESDKRSDLLVTMKQKTVTDLLNRMVAQ